MTCHTIEGAAPRGMVLCQQARRTRIHRSRQDPLTAEVVPVEVAEAAISVETFGNADEVISTMTVKGFTTLETCANACTGPEVGQESLHDGMLSFEMSASSTGVSAMTAASSVVRRSNPGDTTLTRARRAQASSLGCEDWILTVVAQLWSLVTYRDLLEDHPRLTRRIIPGRETAWDLQVIISQDGHQ